ncbi:hypothetical protein KAU11_08130 [Candidatus Babeliales bacterium]|nr:hypothetical protein [Candidatus Babeliales bacterium]
MEIRIKNKIKMEGSKNIFSTEYDNEKLTICLQHYTRPLPKRISLMAYNQEGNLRGTLSVNLHDEDCELDEFFSNEYCENKYWVPNVLEEMMAQGLIEEIGWTANFIQFEGIRKFKLI